MSSNGRFDTIEFRFPGGAHEDEIVIPPRVVGDLGDALAEIFEALLHGRQGKPLIGFLGPRSGSIILVYLLEIASQVTTDDLAKVHAAYSLVKEVAKDFIDVGVALGIFKRRQSVGVEDVPSQKPLLIDEHPNPAQLVSGYRKIVRTITVTTVEEVEITIPAIGTVVVQGARARDVALIGSEGEKLVSERTPFAGTLSNIVGPIHIVPKDSHGKEKIYSGIIERDGRRVPIVITEWRSEVPVERAMTFNSCEVKGDLYPIRFAGWATQDIIDPAMYRAEAALQVRTMTIDS